MQPVNDDMDALFRRAAEDYPLNTGKADFDAVLQKLQQPGKAAAPPAPKEQRRNYSWLLLLLLLIPFVCRYYPGNEDGNGQHITPLNNGKASKPSEDFTTQKNTATTKTFQPENSSTNSGNQLNGQSSAQQSTTNDKPPILVNKPAISSSDKAFTASANTTTSNHTSLGSKKRKTAASATEEITVDKYSAAFANARKQKHSYSRNTKQKGTFQSKAITTTSTGSEPKDSSFAEENIISGGKKNAATGKQDTNLIAAAKSDTTATVKNKTAPPKDSITVDSTATASKKTQKKKEKIKPFFYVGLTGGIDYSVVKSKQTAGTGNNIGLIAGYSFGGHWAVETGLIRAYKKYRSEGEYIDTNGLGLAGHMQVLNVNGSCSIFEIPVNAQFHFGNKAKSHWYVGTGISSYLIKKEDYYYVGKRYNMVYYAEKEYTNSTKNWFSVLQLNGGYQVQMGKLGSLRAEPYVKLPLFKIGIASLPLSSAGINIGYIKPL